MSQPKKPSTVTPPTTTTARGSAPRESTVIEMGPDSGTGTPTSTTPFTTASGSLASSSETGTASTTGSGVGGAFPPGRRTTDGDTGSIGDHNRQGSIASAYYSGPGLLDYAGGEEPEDEGNPLRNESSSLIRFFPPWCHCCSFLRRSDAPEPVHGCGQTVKSMFLCPPQGFVARMITFVLTVIVGWLSSWFLLLEVGEEPPEGHKRLWRSPGAPGGPISALALLLVIGLFAGITMKQFRLPSLLGPLILGIFLRNVHPINIFIFFQNWSSRHCGSAEALAKYGNATSNDTLTCRQDGIESSGHWIKPIRQIALTMILTRAGLELSPKQLKKLKGVVPLLAFGPCLVEAAVCAGITYLLFNVAGDYDGNGRRLTGNHLISIPMCFTAGFALAAVSPAVVVPGMLSLKRRNLGVGQGVPTLLIAASSIDDVLAISMYTICMGIALSGSNGKEQWKTYSGGPISVVVGIAHGLFFGVILHFIPARGNENKAAMRLLLLLLLNIAAMFFYELESVEIVNGAGSLAVLVTAFIASFGWRSHPHWKLPMKKIEHSLALLWTLCVPLLFGTIGREIDFKEFVGLRVLKILGIIFVSLLFRCTAAFLIAGCAKLNWKERLFCALAWIPKATVQAALAPLVVSKIQGAGPGSAHLKPHGEIVVTLAVLAILITAPLGSVLIAFFGPRLLRMATIPEQITLAEEFPNGDGPDNNPELVQLTSKFRNSTQSPALPTSSSLASVQNQGEDPFNTRRSSSAEAVMEHGPVPWAYFGPPKTPKNIEKTPENTGN